MPPRKSNKSGSPQPHFVSVAVVVSDAKRSLQWYTDGLGLDIIDNEDHWITVGRKGQPGMLHLCQPSGDNPSSELEPGNSGVLLRIPGKDFTAACEALKARGVEFTEGPTTADWGTYAVVRDPDGNEHALMPES
jgi:catechol 2,3-dioxygenase-like lactoylglutathione lyase family enzyme